MAPAACRSCAAHLGNVLGPIFVYAMSLIAVSMILRRAVVPRSRGAAAEPDGD